MNEITPLHGAPISPAPGRGEMHSEYTMGSPSEATPVVQRQGGRAFGRLGTAAEGWQVGFRRASDPATVQQQSPPVTRSSQDRHVDRLRERQSPAVLPHFRGGTAS